jgi:membrane protease YdiL (CAAX protease family)
MFPFTHEINFAGWFHLAFFGLLIPASAFVQWRLFEKAAKPLPGRLRHLQTTALEIVMLAALSLAVARLERIELFPRAFPKWRALLGGVLILAAMIVYMRPRWRRAVERCARVVYLYMPANATERAWWIGVAVLAGVGEEITWRGVQGGLLNNLTGNFWLAALICAISFGIGHMIQGWRSVIVVIAFALCFHALVWLAGSLYVAMAVHIAYDVTAGISYGRLGRELGYEPNETTERSSAVTPET